MSYNVELELEDWHQQILEHRKAYKFICTWMAKTMQNLACKQCGTVITTLINRKAVQSCLHWGNKLWSRRLDAKAMLLYLEPAGTCTVPYLKGLIRIVTMSSNLVIKRASWTVAAGPASNGCSHTMLPRWWKEIQASCRKEKHKGCLSLAWIGSGEKGGRTAGLLLPVWGQQRLGGANRQSRKGT